ncbi:hypothetical protein G3O08_06105 [Cryomorpha ignava]|uniref:Uncharacterized protein n=1 Tax=Cryomorpha ignava TaxID=101383 RepID=A0A7K3WN44_9FLAO|nr:hypothetical protein [Cryomorpha ignava]NEN23070.1 hypothetical protein [Cryomorpha ignava]
MKSKFAYLSIAVVTIIFVIGCVTAKKTSAPVSAQVNSISEKIETPFTVYRFRGNVYDRKKSPRFAFVAAIGDSGYIQGAPGNMDSGYYNFSLSAERASKVKALRVTLSQYDTIIQKFDFGRLRDSIVINDFTLNFIPVEYYIVNGYQDHIGGGAISADTIWLDKYGKPIKKEKKWKKE